MRGKLASMLRTTTNDPRIISLSFEQAEMNLSLLIEEEGRWFERWERLLGVTWCKEDFLSTSNELSDKTTIPLSLLIRPENVDALKRTFGLLIDEKDNEDITKKSDSLYMVGKDEFMSRMGGRKSIYNSNQLNESRYAKDSPLKPGPRRSLKNWE